MICKGYRDTAFTNNRGVFALFWSYTWHGVGRKLQLIRRDSIGCTASKSTWQERG